MSIVGVGGGVVLADFNFQISLCFSWFDESPKTGILQDIQAIHPHRVRKSQVNAGE